MNRKITIGIGVVIFILIIFLYYKFKTHPDYLVVVPNSVVATPIRIKKVYTIRTPAFPANTTFTIPTEISDPNVPVFENYTGKDLPAVSTVITGITARNMIKSINIYNIGPNSFNMIGVNLKVVLNQTLNSTNNAIKMTIGTRSATPITYNGDKLMLDQDKQIQFTNLNDFVLQRLTIICNNLVKRSLYIYLTNISDQNTGIRINNLTNDILVIDLYN